MAGAGSNSAGKLKITAAEDEIVGAHCHSHRWRRLAVPNAVICSVAKPAIPHFGAMATGIPVGFEGLVEGRMPELAPRRHRRHCQPRRYDSRYFKQRRSDPLPCGDGSRCRHPRLLRECDSQLQGLGLPALTAIGGDATMHIVDKFTDLGLNVIGVPKTIDNDLSATDVTFGYDSAVTVDMEAVHRPRDASDPAWTSSTGPKSDAV